MQIIDSDQLGKLRVLGHERVAVEVFLEGIGTLDKGIIQRVAVVGCAIEVTIKQFLEEVDISTLGVEHRLPVEVVLNDFLAAVGADAQANSSYFITVVVLHIVRLDVGQLFVDGVLDGVDIA